MTLEEVILDADRFPESGLIFAERMAGEFSPASRAVVLELTDDELRRPTAEIAAARAPGMEYFLEVNVASEVAAARPGRPVEAVLYYAKNDAYPD